MHARASQRAAIHVPAPCAPRCAASLARITSRGRDAGARTDERIFLARTNNVDVDRCGFHSSPSESVSASYNANVSHTLWEKPPVRGGSTSSRISPSAVEPQSGHDCQKGIMAGVCKNRANLTVLHELGWDSKVMVWPHRRRLCGFGREGIHGHLSCVETCRQNLIYAAAP